jgi:hypothetical protein
MDLAMIVARAVPAAATLYLCLLGPGQAWWRGAASSFPRLFGRIALSVLWTTLVGLLLAGTDSFSVPLLVLINGAVTLLGYLYVGLPRREELRFSPSPGTGLVIFILALVATAPAYDTRIAASDSTNYVAAGS